MFFRFSCNRTSKEAADGSNRGSFKRLWALQGSPCGGLLTSFDAEVVLGGKSPKRCVLSRYVLLEFKIAQALNHGSIYVQSFFESTRSGEHWSVRTRFCLWAWRATMPASIYVKA